MHLRGLRGMLVNHWTWGCVSGGAWWDVQGVCNAARHGKALGVVQRASSGVESLVQRCSVLEVLVAQQDLRVRQWLSRAGGSTAGLTCGRVLMVT